MQGAIRTGLAITLLTVLCGCQCSKFYNRYPDLIDDISDCPPRADKWYDPCFDLSRIGKPDWCSCGFNRLWCRCGCARPMEPGFPVPADFATQHPEALGVASGRALKQIPTDIEPVEGAGPEQAPPAPVGPEGSGAPPAPTSPDVPAF